MADSELPRPLWFPGKPPLDFARLDLVAAKDGRAFLKVAEGKPWIDAMAPEALAIYAKASPVPPDFETFRATFPHFASHPHAEEAFLAVMTEEAPRTAWDLRFQKMFNVAHGYATHDYFCGEREFIFQRTEREEAIHDYGLGQFPSLTRAFPLDPADEPRMAGWKRLMERPPEHRPVSG